MKLIQNANALQVYEYFSYNDVTYRILFRR